MIEGVGLSASPDAVIGDTVVASVREQLARPRGERPSDVTALVDQLRTVSDDLHTSALGLAETDPAGAAEVLTRMKEVGELRSQLRRRDLAERLEVLVRIRESMEQLRECESLEELIEAAPRELCRACGFSRAMISRIQGSKWVPVTYESVADPGFDDGVFKDWVERVEIPLEHTLVETELVRRRMPALISDPGGDPRTFSDLVKLGRTSAYVAAPIIPDGRAIGFLHADKVGQAPVIAEDRDNLWAFAEHFALIFHRAVLGERLALQRRQLREAFSEAEATTEELDSSGLELLRSTPASSQTTDASVLFRSGESRIDALLTRREREVLELITSGATNARIAQQLVISEGTVKSHVKHILRKLHVGNRAEAVSRYLQMRRRDEGHGAR